MRRASVLKEATPENLTLAPFPCFPAVSLDRAISRA